MTPAQHRTLVYIERYIGVHGASPCYREIRMHLGIASNSGVHRIVTTLARDGWLEHVPHRTRALRVLRSAAGGAAVYPLLCPDALRDVLGMPVHKARMIWMALREVGQVIRPRYEDEMAAALHFLIPIVLRHGDDWQPAAARLLRDMEAEQRARVANDA